ncbi:MAG TPA: hypothetical protein DDY52_03275 [Candidatus Moranbacteria bacterium]|nr:hypothetical protein [Candidatus Moranbacteria bacterium]
MSLLNFYRKTKKKLNDTFEPVAQKTSSNLGRMANEARNYLNNPNNTPGWMKKADQGLRSFSQKAENIPKFDFAKKVNNPVGRFAAEIPQQIMNIPSRTVAGTFKDYGKTKATPSYLVRRGAEAANIGVDIGSTVAGGGTIKKIATDGFKKASKTGVMDVIKTGAKRGAKEGFIYGGASGILSGAQEGKNLKEQGENALKGGVQGSIMGTVAGGVLGGTIAGGGKVAHSTKEGVKKEIAKTTTDIMNFKNPYTKKVVDKVDYRPNYGIMIHGKPQMVPVPGTERKIIQTIKTPFKPESVLGKVLNVRPGLNIQDMNATKPRIVSSKVMDFNNKIALKNKKAQETIARQQQNQRLRLDKAEKGFVPPQKVKAPQKAFLEVEQNKQSVFPSIEEFVNKKTETKQNKVPSIEEFVNGKKSIKNESPFKGDEFVVKPKKETPLAPPEGGFNKFQERAHKVKGERVDAIREIIDYPKELRAIGYVKKDIDRIGVDQAKRIIKLGNLGYPKNEIQKMDFDRMDLILKREVPYLTLKNYYKKKHELDTNYLEGVNPAKLKDISAPMTGFRDVYRNFEATFGDQFPKIKKELLDPFDAAKGEFINEQKILLNELEENIVKKLGIKKGSKEDMAVVLFGEGKLGEDELRQQFPKQWRNIIEADKWFKNKYPQLLKELNAVREYFFPTHPLYPESTKIIPERKDYYRHGKDLEGIAGLKNMFETSASIDPALAASSDVTNPKTKWLSFGQERKGDANDFGAVEGYLDYIKNHAYAKHVDPFISKFKGVDDETKGALGAGEFFHESRGLSEELSQKLDPIQQITDSTDIAQIKKILTDHKISEAQADWMGKDLAALNNYEKVKSYIKNKTAKNKENALNNMGFKANAELSENKLNNFLVFIKNFSRDLGGKTNPLDRGLQENLFGRKALSVVSWANSRFKANAVLGNASSSLAQYFNIPQGFASAGVKNSAKAIGNSLAGIFKKNTPIKKSAFVNERYFNDYDKFNEGVLANTKKFAIWMTGIGDKIGTKFIWNAHYQKALSEGVSNPIKYADDWTRKMVAGRGIGEVPIAQKSKVFQLVAPFQLEVANQWYALKDIAKNDPSKLVVAKKMLEFTVASYLMNRVVNEVRGSDVSFDPINAMVDAYQEFEGEDGKVKGSLKAGGRIAGEVISNIPGGQTLASMYPEYGFGVNEESFPTLSKFMNIPRKELFGEGDPTRFGTGGLPMFSAVKNPLTGVILPYGGKQLEKTYSGAKSLLNGYVENKTGKVMTPVEATLSNTLRGLMFGKNAFGEMQDYFDNKQTPLSKEQTEKFKIGGNKYFDEVMSSRASDNTKEELKKAVKLGKITKGLGDLGGGVFGLEDGNYYVPNLLADTKTFKTEELARRAVAIDLVANGEANYDSDIYINAFGLDKYTKENTKQGMDKYIFENDKIDTARKIFGEDDTYKNIPDEVKSQIFQKMGLEKDDIEYDFAANQTDDVKSQYFVSALSQEADHQTVLDNIWENRKESIGGKILASNGVIDNLYDAGIISKEERTYLKKVKIGKDGKEKLSSSSGSGTGKKLEEKYRYPLVDNDFLEINALLNGFKSKPRMYRMPTRFTKRRITKVKRRRR